MADFSCSHKCSMGGEFRRGCWAPQDVDFLFSQKLPRHKSGMRTIIVLLEVPDRGMLVQEKACSTFGSRINDMFKGVLE